MENGWGLLLSVAKYYTPAGKEIQQTEPQNSGIRPTVEVLDAEDAAPDPNADDQLEVQPPTKDQTVVQEDRQLKKAIDVLKNPGAVTKKAA
jgi:C-terminal processing protease CtpA/Prc